MTTSRYKDLGPDLVVEELGHIRIVTMSAPERLNSVDDRLHDALRLLWDLLSDDEDARAAILTGAGRAFCAGGHIPNFTRTHTDRNAARRDTRNQERLVRSMIDCELPVIAAVNGPAVGIGASLVVLCDIVVMSDTAFLSDPHVTVGVVAGDGGAVAWPLAMSLPLAKEHLLLGTRLSASECAQLGLANRVTPPHLLMSTAIDLATQLCERAPQAVRDTKRTLNMHLRHAADLTLTVGLLAERDSFGIGDFSAEVREMMASAEDASDAGR